MTKDVIVSITGLQYTVEDTEPVPVEVVVPGNYYFKNGQHYLLYDESIEGYEGTTHNIVKFHDDKVEVHKSGLISVQMIFEENKKNVSFYQTPYGMMNMGVAATKIKITEEKDRLGLTVDYALDLNDSYVADCTISISAHARKQE